MQLQNSLIVFHVSSLHGILDCLLFPLKLCTLPPSLHVIITTNKRFCIEL